MEQWRKNLYTLVTTQICCMVGFGLFMPIIAFYFQEMGMEVGAKLDFAVSLANTLPAVGMAVSSPVWGVLSDRHGRKSMLVRACGCATVIMLLMGMVTSVGPFLVLRLLQGLFTGTITASMAFVSSNTPEEHMSSSLGLLSASNFIGYSIGPVIGGLLAEVIGYRSCFFLSSALMLFATIIVIKVTVEDPSTYGSALVEQRKLEKKRKKAESARKAARRRAVRRSLSAADVPLCLYAVSGALRGAGQRHAGMGLRYHRRHQRLYLYRHGDFFRHACAHCGQI